MEKCNGTNGDKNGTRKENRNIQYSVRETKFQTDSNLLKKRLVQKTYDSNLYVDRVSSEVSDIEVTQGMVPIKCIVL